MGSKINLSLQLNNLFKEAIKKAFDMDHKAGISRGNFSHYQCNSIFGISKIIGRPPKEVAKAIISNIPPNDMIRELHLSDPPFINIFIRKEFICKHLQEICFDVKNRGKAICDFSSPNIAKEMHVGHLRSTIIGDCISRILEISGYDLLKLNHLGDFGTQFGMLIAYLEKEGLQDLSIKKLSGYYKAAAALFKNDDSFKKRARKEVSAVQDGRKRDLWEKIVDLSRGSFNRIYKLLGIDIIERGESFYYQYLNKVLIDCEKMELIEMVDGSKCVFLKGFNNKEGNPLPLILEKALGGYTYATTDLAAFWHRAEIEKADAIYIVTDSGQSLHLSMVSALAKQLGYLDKVTFKHIGFGLVLDQFGKKFKSRSGDALPLIDLLEEAIKRGRLVMKNRGVESWEVGGKILGINAIKYGDLSINRLKNYHFDLERMLSLEGNSAAYVLYSHIRIKSILKKATGFGEISLDDDELALGLELLRFWEVVDDTLKELFPNRLTDYLFTLAEISNKFLEKCRIIGSTKEPSRVLLCELVNRIMEKVFYLLGMQPLEEM